MFPINVTLQNAELCFVKDIVYNVIRGGGEDTQIKPCIRIGKLMDMLENLHMTLE